MYNKFLNSSLVLKSEILYVMKTSLSIQEYYRGNKKYNQAYGITWKF